MPRFPESKDAMPDLLVGSFPSALAGGSAPLTSRCLEGSSYSQLLLNSWAFKITFILVNPAFCLFFL